VVDSDEEDVRGCPLGSHVFLTIARQLTVMSDYDSDFTDISGPPEPSCALPAAVSPCLASSYQRRLTPRQATKDGPPATRARTLSDRDSAGFPVDMFESLGFPPSFEDDMGIAVDDLKGVDLLEHVRSWTCFPPAPHGGDPLASLPLYTRQLPANPMPMSGLPPRGTRFVSPATHSAYAAQDLALTRALANWSSQTDSEEGPDDLCRAVYEKFTPAGISDFHLRRTPANYAEFITSGGQTRDFLSLDDGTAYNGPGNYAYGTFIDGNLLARLAGIYDGETECGYLTAWKVCGQRGLLGRDYGHRLCKIPYKLYVHEDGLRQKPHKMVVTMYGMYCCHRI
jgi:hypothetical protein